MSLNHLYKKERFIQPHTIIFPQIKPIKIKQYDINHNLLNEYTSISEASKESSVTRKAISLYLRKKTKTAGGFVWKYA
jgi:hypothetical protein